MPRRPSAVRGVVLAVALVAPACSSSELGVDGPCGGLPPRTDRPSPDVETYQAANAALLASVPTPHGAELIDIDQSPSHRCPEDRDSEVVGITSIGTFAIPATTSRCDVVDAIEGHLTAHGWQADVLQTADPVGGTIRVTDFQRGTEHITLSIGGSPQDYGLFVDHDSLREPLDPAAVSHQPCSDD